MGQLLKADRLGIEEPAAPESAAFRPMLIANRCGNPEPPAESPYLTTGPSHCPENIPSAGARPWRDFRCNHQRASIIASTRADFIKRQAVGVSVTCSSSCIR